MRALTARLAHQAALSVELYCSDGEKPGEEAKTLGNKCSIAKSYRHQLSYLFSSRTFKLASKRIK